jgi:adenylate cyclase
MCGTAVAPQGVTGEHKQVTVLFADVVGSMKLAAALDAERLREIMNELFNRAAAVVQRYRGTVDKFTGDGLMALFGAPVALEDHALRACIAALEIQSVTHALATEVARRDGVALNLRVGLNSGDVIAGEIGSGVGRYTAVGHPVGLAQRMESVAPAGGVMCSLHTAGWVEDSARLGPVQRVTVKGFDQPVSARQLLEVETGSVVLGRSEGALLGREADLNSLQKAFAADRCGLIGVIGEPGLGKSRLVSEFAVRAERQGAKVVVARGEAHATALAFRMLSLLLRAMFDVDHLSPVDARAHTVAQFGGRLAAQSRDARVLFEAMGIGDADEPDIPVAIEGRRRRLVELMASAVRAGDVRTVFVLEDVHWIDTPSDEVLADFAAAVADAGAATIVVTYRPEFQGALHRGSDQTIRLQPLTDSMSEQLVGQLLGDDPSVTGLAVQIAGAAVGNPYFVEEIVRDLAGREVLSGSRGGYRMAGDFDRIVVPATIQAVLAARIDRLPARAKSVLNAAAVIGAQFDTESLRVLHPDAETAGLSELVSAELIDQTEFVPRQRYCFHHPLVRTVAYESQLSHDRARAHSRLAKAIERGAPGAADENAALIATHLAAAGESVDAYRWHMRAAHWLRVRDVPAARAQWECAGDIADQLPDDRADVTAMRIAPRTLLVSTSLYVGNDAETDRRYREFRDLATQIDDTRSLGIGMAGQLWSITVNDENIHEAAALASELHRMTESAHWDAEATGIVVNAVAFTKFANCEFDAGLRALDLLTTGDTPLVELAPAQGLRGVMELCLGRDEEGRQHLREGIELARADRPMTFTHSVLYAGAVVALGLCETDEFIDDIRDAVRVADALGESSGIVCTQWSYGTVVLRARRGTSADAIDALRRALSYIDEHSSMTFIRPTIIADLAIDAVSKGDREPALRDLRAGFARYAGRGSKIFAGCSGEALVELLTERGSADDLAEARRIVARWQQLRPGIPGLDLWWLRSRTLLARAEGDLSGYAELSAQYLTLCEKLDARGRLDEARTMR